MNVSVPSALPAQGTITEHTVAALPAGRDTVVWDRALTGFGVRVYPSGAKVYVVQARGPQGTKRITVGRHGVIGASEARRRAALIIARIRAGEEPVPEAQKTETVTVATLAQRYLREHVAVRCKPTTAAQYRLAIERYIVPALGTRPVSHDSARVSARVRASTAVDVPGCVRTCRAQSSTSLTTVFSSSWHR